jgi:hypothetical protein
MSQNVSQIFKDGNTTFGINKRGNVVMDAILRRVRLTIVGVEKQYK